MKREYCHTCVMLEDFYRIKLDRFLLAARTSTTWSQTDLLHWDREVLDLKQESLQALRCLQRHVTGCQRVTYHA